jgi:integrase
MARRTRSEGSIYRTADGRWRGAYLVADPVTGRMVRRYLSGRTAAEVRRRLDVLRQQVAGGASGLDVPTGDYLADWSDRIRPRLRPATATSYGQHVRTFLVPALGTVPLARLAPGDVERMMAGLLARGYAPRTVRSVRSTLRRALHDAIRDGLINRNAAGLARPPRVEAVEVRPMTPDQVRVLLASCADDGLWGPFYAVAVTTGLRSGELRALTWSDVDPDRGTLTVRRAMTRTGDGAAEVAGAPKTARGRRTIALPAMTRDALERRRVAQSAEREAAGTAWQDVDGLIFTDAIGRPISGSAASHAWQDALRRAGLPPFRLHDARHTAASLLLAAGVPLRTISETLGHSTIAITADTYAHLGDELRRDAADAMDRALA